jgi:uncharacterized protein YfaS (alpha-2-macroglobulin family)
MSWRNLITIASAIFLSFTMIQASGSAESSSPSLDSLLKLQTDGNYKDAYDGLRRFIFESRPSSKDVVKAYDAAVTSLRQLGRTDDIDEFREKVAGKYKANWPVLVAVAQSYLTIEHYGFLIASEFHRGPHRGGGKQVHATSRDRVRALQLYRDAMNLAQNASDKRQPAEMLGQFAEAIIYGNEAWRLQSLTELKKLPDYEEGWRYGGEQSGAPVDINNNPVFYSVPKTWDAAKNDGERWRWLLETMVEWQPSRRNDERLARARFLESQFGVQTIAQFGFRLPDETDGDSKSSDEKTGTWALHTLREDETIARLASGIKRFKLPDEHNFIKLFEQVLKDLEADKTDEHGLDAARSLALLFENRRQYPRAAEHWRATIERATGESRQLYERHLNQIIGNWGQFESAMSQPAGRGATVDFRFRNARQVEFTVHEVDVRKLLDDVIAYLKSKPKQLEWERMNVSEIGYRLVQDDQSKYIGAEVARWKLDLAPREKHFDKRITITTPLQKAGAYLVAARLVDGNTSKIVLWLADTAIVRKPMPEKSFYFVADAVTGTPINKANVEFFGYRQRRTDGNNFEVEIKRVATTTGEQGITYLPIPGESQDPTAREFQWLATATTPTGRLAYLGFHNVWRANYYDAQYNQVKIFTITDRPVYRPAQTVQFKFWIAEAQYDAEEKSNFAQQSFIVEIHNPKNEKIYSETLTSDNYGGINGKFELPSDATLGQYFINVVNRGGGTFRVEEYKKPEFEVAVDAPSEPVMLGEKITAKIRAKYYFGSPVTTATVKYKVMRTTHTARWFPPDPWDWLYGPGYWWFASDYEWYPGWRDWGCRRPSPGLFWPQSSPPEIVAQREVPIGADGTVAVEIDTSVAKALHPNDDHRYSIQAEVVDESRRTIVGSGEVFVARKPFTVTAWVNRGYYRVGDTIRADFAARRLDGKAVQGTGNLRLLKISYGAAPERKPTETEVRTWKLDTNADGTAEIQLKASEQGQYRLSYRVTDKSEHEVEGGYLFTIAGDGFDGSDFRFNNLELVPDKRDYAPNEKVQLQINTDRVGSTVLLFARPSNGAYLPPQLIHLAGKSTVVELGVTPKDMPNFFVEATTISDGRVHTQVCEIHVPPAQRVLNMEVVPSAVEFKPGQHAKITVKLTDSAGKPYVGSAVLSIFDKSLEYISGGSNVADIKEFFWKWRREHRSIIENNLERWFTNLVPAKKDDPIGQGEAMEDLGVFGATVADELMSRGAVLRTSAGGGFGAGAGRAMSLQMAPAAAAPPKTPGGASVSMLESSSIQPEQAVNQLAQPTVRSEFADTALWVASLETNKDGIVVAELDMPQNLTAWKIRAWGIGHGTRVGEAAAQIVTRKNLIVRMQAPRFFIERDEVVLSANVHNYLPTAKHVKVRLELDGKTLEMPSSTETSIDVPAGGERRVDWRVKAVHEGEAVLRMLALTDQESDAVQMKFPVYVHGMLKTESYSGAIRPDTRLGRFDITVPQQRRADQTRLEVRYSPTLAGAMVDALPYLIDYPYGCTEQTLNRFLPAVITQQTLLQMKLDLKKIQQKRTNLNAQEIGDAGSRAKQWQRYNGNPVFDEAELSKVVKASVNRLQEMQLSDGGWGWFSGWGEQSTAHMTATIVHGLQIAKQNDVALKPGMLERGVDWLNRYQDEELRHLANVDDSGKVIDKTKPSKQSADNLDALVYMVLVDANVKTDTMRDRLYRDRTKLNVYGLAVFGLALNKQHDAERLAMIMRNISQYVVEDDENQTAYLRLPEGIWWYWYGSEIEADAYYLKLLAATEPKNPVASRLVKYLINNRKNSTYWNSTRDTALAIEALADYIKSSREDRPNLTIEVWVDGQKRKDTKITSENLFTFDNAFVLEGETLPPGHHTIELHKSGEGPLYWNGYMTNFTLEDNIRHAGLELKVERHFYKLTQADKSTDVAGGRGQAVSQRLEKYDRKEIPDLGSVTSGDLIEIELTIESKNDYEYIVFEDMKAAGCEPVALQSGYNGNELGAYMELRDNRVSLFVRNLARGRHSVSYRMRAETPGRFSALPTKASAMYAPELRANSDELKLNITDTKQP